MTVLWVLWAAGWAVGALFAGRTRERQSAASFLAYVVPTWFGVLLLFFLPQRRLGVLGRPLPAFGAALDWVGVALVLAGLAFAAWARISLGRLWSGTVTIKEEHAIVRAGPYGLVRHPIYSGMILALTGTALVRDDLAAIAGLAGIVLGLALKVRQEERLLEEHFGAAYRAYRADVPAFVPRLR